MTANQIAYWKYVEDQRHNREMEAETARSNREKESLTQQEIKSKEMIEEEKNLSKRAEIEGKYGPTYSIMFAKEGSRYGKRYGEDAGDTALHAFANVVNPVGAVIKALF